MVAVAWIVALLCVLVGLAGTVLPGLPGAPLVWVGLLVAAWADGFQRVGGWTLALAGLLAASTLAVDLAASALGARRVGASGWAIAGASLGALAGLMYGFVGVFVGPFVGALAGEWVARRNLRHAGRVAVATSLGLALGMAAKMAVVAAMLGVFALAWLLGSPS